VCACIACLRMPVPLRPSAVAAAVLWGTRTRRSPTDRSTPRGA
jgi:hypothetical protein